jgi:hypothetical protein
MMSSFDPPSYPPPSYSSSYPTATYAPTPSVDPSAPIRPRALWFVVGAALIAAGVAAGITLLTVGIVSTSRTVDNFGRFAAPGSAQVRFLHPGTYTIYYESDSEICPHDDQGRRIPGACQSISASHDPPRNLDIVVKDGSGHELPLRAIDNEVSFSVSGKAGQSLYRVSIPTAGTYQVTATGSPGEPYAIAIGHGVFGHLVAYILGAIGAGLFLVALGLVAVIVTGVKRGRRKRERRRAQQGYGGYGGYGPGGYGSGYGPYGGYAVPGSPPSYGSPLPGGWNQPSPPAGSSGSWGPPQS